MFLGSLHNLLFRWDNNKAVNHKLSPSPSSCAFQSLTHSPMSLERETGLDDSWWSCYVAVYWPLAYDSTVCVCVCGWAQLAHLQYSHFTHRCSPQISVQVSTFSLLYMEQKCCLTCPTHSCSAQVTEGNLSCLLNTGPVMRFRIACYHIPVHSSHV